MIPGICAVVLLLAGLPPDPADTVRLDAARAVELALENNHAIALAEARQAEAAAGRSIAFSAFLPQVTASGGYTRLGVVNEFAMATPVYQNIPLPVINPITGDTIGFTPPIPVLVGATSETLRLGSYNNYSLRGTVQQTLFTWGKLLNAYRIAGLTLDLETEGRRRARADVAIQATEGFHNALLAERMRDLSRDSYDQLERHVHQVQLLYDNGLAKKLDLMRAQVSLVNLRAQLDRAEHGLELARVALRTTLGLAPGVPLVLADSLAIVPWDPGLDAAIVSALAHRPELVQLRTTARIADLGVHIARTANLPSAFAQFNYQYARPLGFLDEWGTDWNVTVGVSMPVFTGLGNVNRLAQARARQRQARVGLALLEDAVRLEVEALYRTLAQEAQNISYQRENITVAEQALAMAETGYRNGLATNLEYLDAQLALIQSRVSYTSSLANYRIAEAKLRRAMGIE